MDRRPPPSAGITPLVLALGVAVLLVGLIVSPLVIGPLGVAITLGAGWTWARRGHSPPRVPPAAVSAPPAVERYSRNRFVEGATLALGGLVTLGVAAPAVGFAALPSFLVRRRRPVDLGPLAAFPEGEFLVATFLADPQAGEVSRRAVFVRNKGLLGSLPSFTVTSSRCTHVGCPTQPNGPVFLKQRRSVRTSGGEVTLVPSRPSGFGCPCDGSQFDNEGNRIAGPAPRALDRYEFSIRGGRLSLDRLYSVSRVDGASANARIHSFAPEFAGEPVTGPEAWLYPVAPPS